MPRNLTLLLMGAAFALSACAGGQRGIQQEQRNLTPQQKARVAAVVRTYGSPRSFRMLSAAIVNLQRKNYGNAVQAATLAIESGGLTSRGKSLGYSVRAAAYSLTNRRNLARADIGEALRLDPKNVMALNSRGAEALREGKLTAANSYFSRSIAIRPTGYAYYGRGFVRLVRRQFAGALSDANQSIALFPRPSGPYALRGIIEHAMGRRAAARRDFNEALSRNPQDRLARAGLRALNSGRQAYRPRRAQPNRPRGREGSI